MKDVNILTSFLLCRDNTHPDRPQATEEANAGQGKAKLRDDDLLERARSNVVVENAREEHACPNEEAALQEGGRVLVRLNVVAQKVGEKDGARDVDDGAKHGERVALGFARGRLHGRHVLARQPRLPAAEQEDREVHARYQRFDLHFFLCTPII